MMMHIMEMINDAEDDTGCAIDDSLVNAGDCNVSNDDGNDPL